MIDTTTPGAHSAIRVLGALAELGEATAAAVAERAGLGYSTTTPKLRAWENSGWAERFRTEAGHTLWRLTAAGRAATVVPATEPAPPAAVATADTSADPDGADQSETASGPDTGDEPTGLTESMSAKSDTAGRNADADADAAVVDAAPDTKAASADVDGPREADTAAVAADQGSDAAGARPGPTASGEQPGPTDEDRVMAARRTPGSMRAAVLHICEAHPDRQFKVGELCRLIEEANPGARKASQGAVYNAAIKLAAAGTLTQTVDKPAAFQLSPASR